MAYEIHRNKDKIEPLPVRLLYVTHSSYDQGWHSSQHSHDFAELFYIVEGEGSFIVNNTEYEVKKNQLIVINSNVSHTEKSSDYKSMEYITLGFDGMSFNKKNSQSKESIIIFEDNRIEIFSLIQFLLSELDLDNEESHVFYMSQNILEMIIIKLIQYQDIEVEESSNQKINSTIYEVKKYIDLNYSESLNLDDLAELSHLNKYYLSHTFKEQTGLSPIEYLNETRIKNAKILLKSTNYSVSEISSFTGFSSQSYFSQRFKKITDLSPRQYREA